MATIDMFDSHPPSNRVTLNNKPLQSEELPQLPDHFNSLSASEEKHREQAKACHPSVANSAEALKALAQAPPVRKRTRVIKRSPWKAQLQPTKPPVTK